MPKTRVLTKAVSAVITCVGTIVLAGWMATTPACAQASGENAPNAEQPGAIAPEAATSPSPNASEAIDPAVRDVLSRYGTFQPVAGYGEVWRPTIVPLDWRPYAACHWVNSRTLGWYYDDRTDWGAIIHHYGRWTHDASLGWVWVPGTAFSPGWVAWRTSQNYIGWAPLPPNGDLKAADLAAFDSGGFWTFMETSIFDRGCGGAASLPVALEGTLLGQTQPVTTIAFAHGVWIAVLPDYVVGPLVDVSASFKPWANTYLISLLAKWNVAWNSVTTKTTVNVVDCQKRPMPPVSRPPPPSRTKPCASGFLQPDGRCATPVVIPPPPPPAPPPVCADGRRLDDRGRCRPQQANSTPPVPVEPPKVVGPPPVVIPLPVPVPLPVIVRPCRRPGFVRQPDGHCRNPNPLVIPSPAIVVTNPPAAKNPPLAGCNILTGAAKRRCLDRTAKPNSPSFTTTVIQAHGGNQGAGPARTRRPSIATPTRPRPTVARPAVFRPARPAITRPVVTRPRTPTRRPSFRPTRQNPVSRAVFHPRPQVRAHPAPRRPAAPRGGGGRRRR